MTVRVVIGTILVAATMMILAFVIVNEPARMADFEAGYQGRSIEAGAAIFGTSCVGCHGGLARPCFSGSTTGSKLPVAHLLSTFSGGRLGPPDE